jgi:hypothetical protein
MEPIRQTLKKGERQVVKPAPQELRSCASSTNHIEATTDVQKDNASFIAVRRLLDHF